MTADDSVMTSRRRLALACALALILVVIGWRWWPREASWTLQLTPAAADRLPWESVALAGQIPELSPADTAGWRWSWEVAPAASLHATGATARLAARKAGDYRVTVTVTSADGRTRSASAEIHVRKPAKVHAAETKIDPAIDDDRPELPYHITSVQLDKPAICRGEETLLHITAAHVDPARQSLLQPWAGGHGGWDVPIRINQREPGFYPVSVIVRADTEDPDPGQQTTIYVELKDCVGPLFLQLHTAVVDYLPDTYELAATAISGPEYDHRIATDWAALGQTAPPLPDPHVSAFRWDFGDGMPQEQTTEPSIRHRYPAEEYRPEGEIAHFYPVRVSALDADGKEIASASNSLAIQNPFRRLRIVDHTIHIATSNVPMAVGDDHGNATVEVTLKNQDLSETAVLDELKINSLDCSPELEVKTTVARSVSALGLQPRVPPRSQISWTFRWPDPGDNGTCHLQIFMTGKSEPSGLAVVGAFMVRTSGREPGARRVTDPELLALIRKARAAYPPGYGVGRREFEELEAKGVLPKGSWDKVHPATPEAQ